ncbi:hypothetical protein BBD41_18710 [Paenibacillus ihbetae]|uniref:Uncharacterized protein n=1 Tax=Paenibacillus ihbetae TaxID=1870820 RepID=A0A1B2E3B6_9BACL|nr:hypothetical protein BBD41_18710 [Paenibacillus ihbetae]
MKLAEPLVCKQIINVAVEHGNSVVAAGEDQQLFLALPDTNQFFGLHGKKYIVGPAEGACLYIYVISDDIIGPCV